MAGIGAKYVELLEAAKESLDGPSGSFNPKHPCCDSCIRLHESILAIEPEWKIKG